MPRQGRVTKSTQHTSRVGEPEAETPSRSVERRLHEQNKGKKVKEDLDEILDEIDELLESNAEEFVKSYVQKGGE